jgi:DNA-directed RNA polymerase specialized sigma24 family protein
VVSDQVFLELPLTEIAKRRGLSVPAVKARAHRAQKMLSRTMNTRRVAMRAAV